MSTELFFIYDSHCPWSYAATPLVNEIAKAIPTLNIHFWHGAYFEGDEIINHKQLNAVSQMSNTSFSSAYKATENTAKDSTLAANVLSWANEKSPQSTLSLLNAIQEAHFQQGLALTNKADIDDILQSLKLSPPNKALTTEKLTKDAENSIHNIFDMQDVIGTKAIPALLLAVNDNLTLINHNLYLKEPQNVVDAIKYEMNK